MEIGEIQPQSQSPIKLQPPSKASRSRTVAPKKATTTKPAGVSTRSRTQKKLPKSALYVEDSDGGMDRPEDDDEQGKKQNSKAPGASGKSLTFFINYFELTRHLIERPKPRPKPRKIAPQEQAPTSSAQLPPPPSSQPSQAFTPPTSTNPMSPEASRRVKVVPQDSNLTSLPGDHPKVMSELKRLLAPTKPASASIPPLPAAPAAHITATPVSGMLMPSPTPPPPPPPPSLATSRSVDSQSDRGSAHGRSMASSHESVNTSSYDHTGAPSAVPSSHPEYHSAYGAEGRHGYRYTRGEERYDDRYVQREHYSGYAPGPPGYLTGPARPYDDSFNHRYREPTHYQPPPPGPYHSYHQYGGEHRRHQYSQPPPPSPYMDYIPYSPSIPAHTRRHPDHPTVPSRASSRASSPEAGPSRSFTG